jgi:hypothetical protein
MEMTTFGHLLRGLSMEDCPCLIPDENDNCVDCGKHIEITDVAEPPNLGDIPGIVRLIESTAKTYAEMVKDNTDPAIPTLPRLRLIGGQFVRIPHKAFYKLSLGPSYNSAKALGYRGTFERWTEIVQEALPAPMQLQQHH